MKSPKAITAAIVAVALTGGIGLAYAQTTDSTTSNDTMQNQGAGSGTAPGANAAFNSAPAANSADTGTAAPGTDTSFQTERPAQADRN